MGKRYVTITYVKLNKRFNNPKGRKSVDKVAEELGGGGINQMPFGLKANYFPANNGGADNSRWEEFSKRIQEKGLGKVSDWVDCGRLKKEGKKIIIEMDY